MQRLFAVLGLALAVVLCPLIALAAININTATKDELVSLPGIGPAKAQAIVDYRKAHGPFKTVEESKDVKGIGAKRFEKLKPDLAVTGASPRGPPSSRTRRPVRRLALRRGRLLPRPANATPERHRPSRSRKSPRCLDTDRRGRGAVATRPASSIAVDVRRIRCSIEGREGRKGRSTEEVIAFCRQRHRPVAGFRFAWSRICAHRHRSLRVPGTCSALGYNDRIDARSHVSHTRLDRRQHAARPPATAAGRDVEHHSRQARGQQSCRARSRIGPHSR